MNGWYGVSQDEPVPSQLAWYRLVKAGVCCSYMIEDDYLLKNVN